MKCELFACKIMKIKQKLLSILLWSLALFWAKLFSSCTADQQQQLETAFEFVNRSAAGVNATNVCPVNSICNAKLIGNETAYRCKCLANYELNRSYNISGGNCSPFNSTTLNNDSIATANVSAYCLPVFVNRVYVHQPAKVEHLAFGILLVLFVVIAAVVLLYLLKIARPIKRSKAAYIRLKRRREQRQPLEEFNEDDISMIQLNENRKC